MEGTGGDGAQKGGCNILAYVIERIERAEQWGKALKKYWWEGAIEEKKRIHPFDFRTSGPHDFFHIFRKVRRRRGLDDAHI